MTRAINCDLREPGQNYEGLRKATQDLGDSWHCLGSTWLVDTSLSANGVWDRLAPYVDKTVRVLVIGVTRGYQVWLPEGAWRWITDRASRLAA